MKITKYEYTQDIHERLNRQVYGNGTETRYGYDEHDRINHMEARSRDGQQIFKQEYKYDELGNRAELNWSIEGGNGQTSRYTYDTQYQLTRVDYDDLNRKPYIYRYDDNGNRTYFGHEHGEEYYAYEQYDRLIQRYTNTNAKTLYKYDDRGNLVHKENRNPNGITDTTDYDFDIRDTLRSIRHNGQLRAEYEYDSRGMRTRSIQHRIDKRPDPFALFGQQPGILKSEQYYWYGAGTEVLADTDEKGNVTGLYIMSGGQKVASVASRASATDKKLRYYHTDALGSVTAITDEEGKVIEANIYGPFGETEFSYKATLHKVIPEKRAELLIDPFLYASDNRYTYTGQEQDEFGGLLYYNARWYDAEVGRFISEDPAAANPNDPLTINRYIYCRNNPLIYTDPTGEIFGIDDFVFIAICAVIGGIGNTIDAMTNPKNQWHGGNYNDAFWHGFWEGAKVGQMIIMIDGIVNAFSSVAKTADGVGSATQPDLQLEQAIPTEQDLSYPMLGSNIPDAGTVQPNATSSRDMTSVKVKATGAGGTYESTVSIKGSTYSASSLPSDATKYATIAPGKYNYEVLNNPKYGKSLLINDGKLIPTTGINPNPSSNYFGQPFADGIYVHMGRNSQGCITVAPSHWSSFMSNFEIGATGTVRVVR